MKVVFMINSLLGGGAQRVVSELCNYMCAEHDVNLILIENKIDYKINSKVKLHILNGNILTNIYKLNKIYKHLSRGTKVDLFFSNLPKSDLIVRLSKVKSPYYIIHSIRSKQRTSSNSISFLEAFIYKIMYKNQNIISVSNSVKKDLMIFFNIKSNQITTIYNPFDINEINNLASIKFNKEFNYFIGVGSYTPIKRFDKLIKLFSKLIKYQQFKDYKLVLVGDGKLINEYQNLSNSLHITDKVIFTGWLNNPYIYIKNAECLVVSSEHESFGNVVLESLCVGTPVYSYKNFGPEEILEKVNVNFSASDNENKLIKNILNFKYYKFDYEELKCFDIEQITKKYLELNKEKEKL